MAIRAAIVLIAAGREDGLIHRGLPKSSSSRA